MRGWWRWYGIPWLVRRWAVRRGVRSANDVVYFVAMFVIGRSAFLRRSARLKGMYGRDPVWLFLARFFMAKDLMARLRGPKVEVVTTEKLRAGDRLQIGSIPPTSRRGRRSTSS